jgi:hypothetical protein
MILPLVFRFVVTEKSMAWIYRHHVDWDTPVEAGEVDAAKA